MPITSVVIFKDSQGNSHDSEDAARHANGVYALMNHLREIPGHNLSDIQVEVIARNVSAWYLLYLDGSRA